MKKNNEKRMKKRDLKNFLAYVKYQSGHGVSLDDALKNLGYVRIEKSGANPKGVGMMYKFSIFLTANPKAQENYQS